MHNFPKNSLETSKTKKLSGGRGVDRPPDFPPHHRAEASEPRAEGQPGHRGLERGVGEVLQDGRRPGQEGDLRQVRPQNVEGLQL